MPGQPGANKERQLDLRLVLRMPRLSGLGNRDLERAGALAFNHAVQIAQVRDQLVDDTCLTQF